jgi:hypothetical protein
MIWTKSDVLDAAKVEELLDFWTGQIEDLLRDKASGLFIEMQELEMLCSLRGEIISLLLETDEDVSPFTERICNILVDEIAKQTTRLMFDRVRKLHDLEPMAIELIINFKGISTLLNFLTAVDEVSISAWEAPTSKQPKLEQILSLKTAQERPLFKDFSKRYVQTMAEVRDGERLLSRLIESSKDDKFGTDDISKVLQDHKQALKSEIAVFSQAFDKILDGNVAESSFEENIVGIVAGLGIC